MNAAKNSIRSLAIVGGGVAGWMAAATLARVLNCAHFAVRMIDAPQVNASASESTIPAIHRLHNLLGFNEADLMRRTQATFKLGAAFSDWGKLDDRYLHTFGTFGARLEAVGFHHHWLRLRQAGDATPFEQYSTASVAAKHGKFAHPVADKSSVLSLFSYAYHVDAALYADYLAEYAQARGVVRTSGAVGAVELREDGFIAALMLEGGERVEADFYIDCSSEGAIAEALQTPSEDWRHWLPCDRAIAISTESVDVGAPLTHIAAREAGWLWRIPLQHRVDTGYAYSSAHLSDDEARATLMREAGGRALSEPRLLSFSARRPRRFWSNNCLSLPSDTLEPLEATRLHLIQTGIMRLVTIFPDRSFNRADEAEYNRLAAIEHERIRDMLILHYKATTRSDSEFWNACRAMPVPDTVRRKLALFEASGRVAMLDDEHFNEESWLSVLLGQNIVPRDYDPLAECLGIDAVKGALAGMKGMIGEGVAAMASHQSFLERYCRAEISW